MRQNVPSLAPELLDGTALVVDGNWSKHSGPAQSASSAPSTHPRRVFLVSGDTCPIALLRCFG